MIAKQASPPTCTRACPRRCGTSQRWIVSAWHPLRLLLGKHLGTLICGALPVFCVALLVGCRPASDQPTDGNSAATTQADAATAQPPANAAPDSSSVPSTVAASEPSASAEDSEPPRPDNAADDLTPPDDVEQSLAQHAQAVRDAFDRYEEIEKLIYPFGWVRRRLVPVQVSHEVLARAGSDQPQRGTVRIRLQQVCSVIHPTREAAAADDDLRPFAPQSTREEMRESPLNPKLEPLELEITYEYRNGRWQRTDWKLLRPKLSRSSDWLDRIGIP